MPTLSPEAWAQIRYDYEHTDRTVADICAEYGITGNTLRDRVRRWNWTPRHVPISREGPPAVAPRTESPALEKGRSPAEAIGDGGREGIEAFDGATIDPLPVPPLSKGRESAFAAPSDPASIAPRLQSAVAHVLPAIEATVARLAAGPQNPREMEQAARALGTLTRTLRELNGLLSQHPVRSAAEDYDDIPEDIDAFREALADRIEAMVESWEQSENEQAQQKGGTPAES